MFINTTYLQSHMMRRHNHMVGSKLSSQTLSTIGHDQVRGIAGRDSLSSPSSIEFLGSLGIFHKIGIDKTFFIAMSLRLAVRLYVFSHERCAPNSRRLFCAVSPGFASLGRCDSCNRKL